MADRLIFHVDVNSAYLSWTSVRRLQNGESDLRNIPAVIGGDPSKRTSIVTAKSIPAKAYGIRTGEPVSQAVQQCPGLVIALPDFPWYETCSRNFMAICRKYAPVVEQFSIDECFLDMTGTASLYPDPVEAARTIKDEIRQTLGFTVNVGIGNNKLLAKMASDFEKPDKVHTLFREEIPTKMWPLPVGELLFVGRSAASRLEAVGLKTIGDLAHADKAVLSGLLGEKTAVQYLQSANGIDDSPVREEPRETKGFSISTTTEEDIRDRSAALEILKELSDSVSFRMRSEGFRAYGIGVRIRSGNYSIRVDRSHQKKLSTATDITREIYENAASLFDELWDGKTGIRLLGISLFDLTKEEISPIDLFGTDQRRSKMEKMDQAADKIRRKYGFSAISQGIRGSDAHIGRNRKGIPESPQTNVSEDRKDTKVIKNMKDKKNITEET